MSLFSKIVGKLLAFGMTLSFVGLILAVLLQVFARLFLPKVPSWTEEISRFLLIWMVSCGAGLAMRNSNFVNVDLFVNKLPARARLALAALSDALVIFLMSVFGWYAWPHFMNLGGRQTSPAMNLSMRYVFFAFVVMAAGIVLFALFSLAVNCRRVLKGE